MTYDIDEDLQDVLGRLRNYKFEDDNDRSEWNRLVVGLSNSGGVVLQHLVAMGPYDHHQGHLVQEIVAAIRDPSALPELCELCSHVQLGLSVAGALQEIAAANPRLFVDCMRANPKDPKRLGPWFSSCLHRLPAEKFVIDFLRELTAQPAAMVADDESHVITRLLFMLSVPDRVRGGQHQSPQVRRMAAQAWQRPLPAPAEFDRSSLHALLADPCRDVQYDAVLAVIKLCDYGALPHLREAAPKAEDKVQRMFQSAIVMLTKANSTGADSIES